MDDMTRSLARLENLLQRAHHIGFELEFYKNDVERGTDLWIERKSLEKEKKFLLRESRRLVSTLMVNEDSKRLVSDAVSSAIKNSRVDFPLIKS